MYTLEYNAFSPINSNRTFDSPNLARLGQVWYGHDYKFSEIRIKSNSYPIDLILSINGCPL